MNTPLRCLRPEQVAAYERDGFVHPVPVLAPEEVRACRTELEAWEQARGALIDFPEKSKSYLLFDWADRLVHHPRILDAVEDVIGPDILVYHSTLFVKEAHTGCFVRWHQDSAYFYLEPHLHVTAWVALSDASELAGCMHALPGSHRWGAFEHDDQPGPLNMIRRGQGIRERFDQETGVPMPLAAGEMSLHHTDLVHASGPNRSDDRRIELAISFIPAHVRPVGAVRPHALCVRGQDHGHFTPERRLAEALSEQDCAQHREALAAFRALQDAGFRQLATNGAATP
jgi:non-heme Fe2+,alpha-ketoglutarate-dependent halogenase